jgi:DNA invertase Pin-like site-specific DNA recombinase
MRTVGAKARPRGVYAVAYVRVSSAAQSAATQRHAIRRAAQARGDKIRSWYVETMTGGTTKRPVLDRLRADVRAGRAGRLYVYRVDRLTRTGIVDTLALVDELRAHGCEVVSLADGLDFSGPAGEVVLAVIAWASKLERLAIGERVSAARKRIESEGGSWGRPSRMSSSQLWLARELRAKGSTLRDIAIAVKVPRSTVARALSRNTPRNAGDVGRRKRPAAAG